MPSANIRQKPSIIAYKPQIDGLRFCAVFIVLFYHYLPILRPVSAYADISILLAFFFVLSSYLITQILLTGKDRTLTSGLNRTDVCFAFLIRRTLRIFPAYYVYLFLLFLIPEYSSYIQERSLSFYTYTANYLMYNEQKFGEMTGHLWTLAVEEQFYLVWPWIILFTPTRYLRSVLIFLIAVGVGSRILMYFIGDPDGHVTPNVLTPTCLDSFALGALLALDHKEGKSYNSIHKVLLAVMVPIWLAALLTHTHLANVILQRLIVSFAAVLVIDGANKGFKNLLGRILECKPVLFLARISYGIYLYHLMAVFIFWKLLSRTGAIMQSRLSVDPSEFYRIFSSPAVSVTCYFILSVLLALLSWYLVERPMNSLKRFFNYANASKIKEKENVLPVEVRQKAPSGVRSL